eukprot:tig00021432_g21214.t1
MGDPGPSSRLLEEKHKAFVLKLERKKDSFEALVSEHLRMSGAYWGISAMCLMNALDEMNKQEIIDWLLSCQHESGGFGGNADHDPHLLYTLSAVQILAIFDELGRIDQERVAQYVAGLQQPDGSFAGDEWGEIDTRFSYCALNCLALLGRLGAVDVKKATDFVASCRNFDGGFGCVPMAESHAGQIFCCVGALAIGGALEHVDRELLGWWLCERQVKEGGLNGRPDKKPDVCYSWWVVSSLAMIGKLHWIDADALKAFILESQDPDGGIADRPGDMADVFHTFFGIAGLSLLGHGGLRGIDPVFALPVDVVHRLNLPERRDVFLAYSLSEKEIAERLQRDIVNAGFTCWLDLEDWHKNSVWSRELEEMLSYARKLVLLIPEDATPGEVIQAELECARAQQKDVLIVAIKKFDSGTAQAQRHPALSAILDGQHPIMWSGSMEEYSGMLDSLIRRIRLVRQKSAVKRNKSYKNVTWHEDQNGALKSLKKDFELSLKNGEADAHDAALYDSEVEAAEEHKGEIRALAATLQPTTPPTECLIACERFGNRYEHSVEAVRNEGCFFNKAAVEGIMWAVSLFAADARALAYLFRVVWILARSQGNRPLFLRLNAVPLLFDAMQKHAASAPTAAMACAALWNLALSDDAVFEMLQMNGVSRTVACMLQHPDDANVAEMTCGLLRNLGLKSKKTREQVVSLGGFSAVLQACGVHRQEALVQEQAVLLLWCLLFDGRQLPRAPVRELDEAVHRAMGLHPNVYSIQTFGQEILNFVREEPS